MIQSPAGYQGDVRIKRYLDFYQPGYGVAMLSSGVAFSPLSLFAQGEQGGWYDPSDLTTMFQDAAGTTAAALESPVGLVLDKSKGLVLGGELVTPAANRDFSSDTGFWTKDVGVTISGGKANWTNATQDYALVKSSFFSASRYYEVTFTISNYSSGGIKFFTNFSASSFTPAYTANGTYTVRFYYGAFYATTPFGFYASSTGTTLSVDDVSVRELPGNHLSQSTSTARPVLSARVNLLTRTEEFDNAAWVKGNLVTTGMANVTATTDPLGGYTADKLQETTANAEHYAYQSVTVAATQYTFSVYLKAAERTWATIYFSSGPATPTWFDLATDGSGGKRTVASGFTADATHVGNGWYRCSITGTSTAGTWYTIVNPSLGNNVSVAYAGTQGSGIYIWGADLRPANSGVGLPAYQRVGAATSGSSSSAGTADYDATGFPYYLKGDGVDDHLLGPNISNLITASDYEACVGARFIAVTTNTSPWLNQSLITENAGYVGIGAARSTGVVAGFNFDTNQDEATVSMVAPATIVLQQRHTGGNIIVSTNGGSEASAASGDTGSVSNPMQVLKALGAVYTNGHIYGIVIRQTPFTAGERASIRDWMNSKTKAF